MEYQSFSPLEPGNEPADKNIDNVHETFNTPCFQAIKLYSDWSGKSGKKELAHQSIKVVWSSMNIL